MGRVKFRTIFSDRNVVPEICLTWQNQGSLCSASITVNQMNYPYKFSEAAKGCAFF